jgi:hypothetical protein
VSSEALRAFEDFMFEDSRASELKPHLVGTLLLMAYKCGSKPNPFVYFQGDALLAALLGVSTKTISTNRKELEKLKIIVTIQEHACRSRNKRVRLCLLQEEEKGGSVLPPLEGSEVEVELTKGVGEGGSPTPERWKPASSKKGENKKIESNAEQFFNELIPLLPNFYSKITFRKNLEKLFNDLEKYDVKLIAHYLKRKDLGKSPEEFLFINFTKALEDFLKDPRQAVEDFKQYKDRKISEGLNVAVERSPLAPDKRAEFRNTFESLTKKNLEQN